MSKYRTSDVERLANLFRALSNPQRLRIFLRLATCCDSASCCRVTPEGIRQCVGDLGAGLGLAASTVSHHIKELRRAGLLEVERRGQRIECWINGDVVHLLAEFIENAGPENLPAPKGADTRNRRSTKGKPQRAAARGARARVRHRTAGAAPGARPRTPARAAAADRARADERG
jgi:ArsR family transcriptional regulator, arsenate/arsenite/antimonite-responsive transcriptional repressor